MIFFLIILSSIIRLILSDDSVKIITIVEGEKQYQIPFKSEYFNSVSTKIKVNRLSDTDNLEISVNSLWTPIPLNNKKDTIYPFPIL